MAKKEKPTSKDFDAQRDTEAKQAKQKLKEAEKAKSGGKKEVAEKTPKKKKTRRFWKDFRGELKKIVWPDFKTVMKNTGIVLLTTVIIGVPVWLLDFALSEGVLGLKNAAKGGQVEQTAAGSPEDALADLLAGLTTAAQATQPAAETTQPAAETTEAAAETTVPATEPAQ